MKIPRWFPYLKVPQRELTLHRLIDTYHGIIGRLDRWYTLENKWIDNTRRISCIPEGTYECRPGYYNAGGYPTWEIIKVPNRSHILFHIGNTEDDTAGCILLGKSVGILGEKIGILQSGIAHTEFMEHLWTPSYDLNDAKFTLHIKEYRHGH